jgi:hypothetical protein
MDSSALLSSIAALRNSITILNRQSDSLEPWLYFWVALVALGVVMEVWFVVWEHMEAREAFQRGTIRSPESPSIRKLLVHLLAAGLVAIGVSGEFVIDLRAGSMQTGLRNKNGELNQLLGNASGAALKDAAGAIERAAVAESHLAQAKADAESARALAKGFEAQIAESTAGTKRAEAEVASANARAAEAERRTAELAELYASRSLNGAQATELAKQLSIFSETAEVVVVSPTTEARSFSYGIEGIVLQANWKVRTVYAGSTSNVTYGVLVSIAEGSPTSTAVAATAFIEGLRKLRIAAWPKPPEFPAGQLAPVISFIEPRQFRWDTATRPTIRIEIGDKPPFPVKF